MELLIILYFVCLNILPRPEENRPKASWGLDRTDARVIAWKKSVQKYERKRIDIDTAEKASLKATFRDIENAYTNYQVEVMEKAMANVSNRVDHVQDQLFSDLHCGMKHFLADYFIHRRGRCRQFGTPTDFKRYLAAHTQAVLFIGECYCRRNEYYNGELPWMESGTFGALKEYVDQYRNEGKKDFEAIAQKYLDNWIAHIESDQGFIRRYAHCQMDMSWPAIELGKITREDARRGALTGANTLIKLGYTPKWLDEIK